MIRAAPTGAALLLLRFEQIKAIKDYQSARKESYSLVTRSIFSLVTLVGNHIGSLISGRHRPLFDMAYFMGAGFVSRNNAVITGKRLCCAFRLISLLFVK